ncbi:Fic family protein [Elusimicrobiota bacterium]
MMPILPSKTTPELDQLTIDVIGASAALGKGINALILKEIARFMLKVNSYYTNAMEGNPSKLKDIEEALNRILAQDKTARNYQLEHLAHIQVQEAMIKRLQEEPDLRICSESFLRWLHEQFYLKLPDEMRFAKTMSGNLVPIEPGCLRRQGAAVGSHQCPETEAEIKECLARFEELLSPENLAGPKKLLAMASSHHRLLWIHPFSDGNGRAARLFATAYGIKIGVCDNTLWTVTRSFARNRNEYDYHLALADRAREHDWDGRGPLSEEGLTKFCAFFLESCKDQINYMDGVLSSVEFGRRYSRYIKSLMDEKQVSKSSAKVMERLLLQGEIKRSSVPDICRVKQRRASQIITEILKAGIVRSETPYGPLKLNISVDMANVLFPALAGE